MLAGEVVAYDIPVAAQFPLTSHVHEVTKGISSKDDNPHGVPLKLTLY